MDLKSILGWLRGRGAAGQGPRQEQSVNSPAVPPQGPPAEPPPDDADAEALLAPLRRRAIRMQVGGLQPPEGPGGSWFGRVNLALPGEEWPTYEGRPMLALAQIDLTQLPFRPPRLDDVEVITVFIDDGLPVVDGPNGDGWCLRAYPDRSALVPAGAGGHRLRHQALSHASGDHRGRLSRQHGGIRRRSRAFR
jgi:hypothetical protein